MTVVLQDEFEGANLATTNIVDATGRHTMSFNAGAALSTTYSKWGTSSFRGEGLGEYVSAPDSDDFSFGSGAWTIGIWVRAVSFIGTLTFMAHYNTTGNQREWLIQKNGSGELEFIYSTDGTAFASVAAAMNTTIGVMTFISADCDGAGTVRIYQDGGYLAKATSVPGFNASSTSLFSILARGDGSVSMQAYVGEIYVNKGEALWASDSGFTAPTAPLYPVASSAVAGVATPQYRSLLLGV